MLIYIWNRQAGTSSSTGFLSATLGAMVLTAAAIVPAQGASALSLGSMSVAGAGRVQISGASEQTFGSVSLAGSGTVLVRGTCVAGLDSVVLTGTGTVESTGITGSLGIEFDVLSLGGSGTVLADVSSAVQGLLTSSRLAHLRAIRLRGLRKNPVYQAQYITLMTEARDKRVSALSLDPSRVSPPWKAENVLVPRGKIAHDELMAFYLLVLG